MPTTPAFAAGGGKCMINIGTPKKPKYTYDPSV
jgi:hypothetical protein